jgi:beta-phosphoglucomutase-like phosphatase (HAD superfamily)
VFYAVLSVVGAAVPQRTTSDDSASRVNQWDVSDYKLILVDDLEVIADTMTDNFRAWLRAFGNRAVQIDPAEYFPFEGMEKNQTGAILGSRHGLPAEEAAAIAEEKARTCSSTAGSRTLLRHLPWPCMGR